MDDLIFRERPQRVSKPSVKYRSREQPYRRDPDTCIEDNASHSVIHWLPRVRADQEVSDGTKGRYSADQRLGYHLCDPFLLADASDSFHLCGFLHRGDQASRTSLTSSPMDALASPKNILA